MKRYNRAGLIELIVEPHCILANGGCDSHLVVSGGITGGQCVGVAFIGVRKTDAVDRSYRRYANRRYQIAYIHYVGSFARTYIYFLHACLSKMRIVKNA